MRGPPWTLPHLTRLTRALILSQYELDIALSCHENLRMERRFPRLDRLHQIGFPAPGRTGCPTEGELSDMRYDDELDGPSAEPTNGSHRGRQMTPAEIAVLMREVAGTDEIGADDDFFHAGGKSWGALMLMVQLEEQSGVKISLLDFFQARTPSRLAALIADRSVAER